MTLNPATLAPASFGLSKSTGLGDYKPGEVATAPDDNFDSTPAAPVWSFGCPTPRTCGFLMNTSAHKNTWGGNDSGLGAGGNIDGSDEDHPVCWTTVTGTDPAGHVAVTQGGGANNIVFSATSGKRIYDANFMVPILSDGTDTFHIRFGWTNVLFGAITNGIYLQADSNTDPQFQVFTTAASAPTQSDTGITLVAGTWYRFRIVVTNNSLVEFYIAAEGASWPTTPTVSHTLTIPTGTGQAMQPTYLVKKSAGTTTRALSTYYVLSGADRYGT